VSLSLGNGWRCVCDCHLTLTEGLGICGERRRGLVIEVIGLVTSALLFYHNAAPAQPCRETSCPAEEKA